MPFEHQFVNLFDISPRRNTPQVQLNVIVPGPIKQLPPSEYQIFNSEFTHLSMFWTF